MRNRPYPVLKCSSTYTGSRTMRNRPYPVLKCSLTKSCIFDVRPARPAPRTRPRPMAMDCMTKFYFFMAIFTAVICNVVIKAMMEIKSVGTSGELEPFTPASYLTLLMAFGMFFALPWHTWQDQPDRKSVV